MKQFISKMLLMILAISVCFMMPCAGIYALEDEEIYEEIEGEECTVEVVNKKDNKNSKTSAVQAYNSEEWSIPTLSYLKVKACGLKSGYKFFINNIGIGEIDSVTLKLTVYDSKGNKINSTTKTFTNVEAGSLSWTWLIKISATVQEKLNLKVISKTGNKQDTNSGSLHRYNFVGGKYSKISALDGHRHHMPSKEASPLTKNSGPAVRMVAAEHQNTASYGGGKAINFRAKEKAYIKDGYFLKAQNLGIQDLQEKYGKKYNSAINEMVAYTKSLGYTK